MAQPLAPTLLECANATVVAGDGDGDDGKGKVPEKKSKKDKKADKKA